MSRGFASNYRIVLLATVLLGCFVGLGVRLVFLHVIDREDLIRNIAKTRRQTTRETARRGDIFDSSGGRLATSRPMIVVAVDPMLVRDEDQAKLPKLAQLLGLPLEEVRRKFNTQYRTAAATPRGAAGQAPAEAPASSASSSLLKLNFTSPASGHSRRDTGSVADTSVDPEFAKELVTNNGEPSAEATAAAAIDVAEQDEDEVVARPDAKGLRPIRWAKLSDSVSESTFAEIESLGIRALCPPERRFARVYPHNQLASHIVGYANRLGHGVAGIEAYADFYLRGQDGWREGEKDGRRRELAQFRTHDIPRADGYSVVLSIDVKVQDIIERELAKVARAYKPLKATVIVSDPRTGFILGMANYPSFNPNEYNLVPKAEMARLKNVAVADVYEPGSVFKIVAAAAALEENLVSPETVFNCSLESITFRDRVVDLPAEDHRFDHPLTVAEIIAKSSNRGAAQLAIQLGESRFEQYARRFGFGRTLGFPVGGEVRGLFKSHDKWVPKDITRIAMGHSIAVTALQMHQAMSAVANGGVLMRPQVVREIRDTGNAVVYQYGPDTLERVVSERTARTMARLLRGVAAQGGTAPDAAIRIGSDDYEVAGKTGTSQKLVPEVQPNGRVKLVYSRKHHVASFVGFFPASRPQVAISVIIDDADHTILKGVAYGSKVAAPVFKSIGEKLIPILSITPPNQPVSLDLIAATQGVHR